MQVIQYSGQDEQTLLEFKKNPFPHDKQTPCEVPEQSLQLEMQGKQAPSESAEKPD